MPTLAVEQVLSGASLGLESGLVDILVFEAGGRRILFALSRTENLLIEVEIASDGTLDAVDEMSILGLFAAGSDPAIVTISDGVGAKSLVLAGMSGTSGQLVSLTPEGSLGEQFELDGTDILVAPQAVDLGGSAGLITGRPGAGGLDLLTFTGSDWTFSAAIEDSEVSYLADVSASAVFEIGADDYIVSASAIETGINAALIMQGALIQIDALGAAEGLPISVPSEVAVVQRGPETLLVVGAAGSSSISTIRFDPVHGMQIADHILDSIETRFQGVSALDTVVHGDFAFAAAAGSDGGVSLFAVLPGGRLVHIDSITDTSATSLNRVSAIQLVATGDRLDLIASSATEPGITRVGYDLSMLGAVIVAPGDGSGAIGGMSDDQIIGSDLGETLQGGNGADTILDGHGEDLLLGGEGGDLFILLADGVQDEIADFEPTEDRLDLSSFDFLYDVGQLNIVETSDGAILSFGAETLVIRTVSGAPLTIGELSNNMILNLDRPSLVPIAQSLAGGVDPDILNGAAGNDTIFGNSGDDILSGRGGNDHVSGGEGDDTLDGGDGADTLSGDSGNDLLIGGAGNDFLSGGLGGDLIHGDGFDWTGG